MWISYFNKYRIYKSVNIIRKKSGHIHGLHKIQCLMFALSENVQTGFFEIIANNTYKYSFSRVP
jgi:hypothetical protein